MPIQMSLAVPVVQTSVIKHHRLEAYVQEPVLETEMSKIQLIQYLVKVHFLIDGALFLCLLVLMGAR